MIKTTETKDALTKMIENNYKRNIISLLRIRDEYFGFKMKYDSMSTQLSDMIEKDRKSFLKQLKKLPDPDFCFDFKEMFESNFRPLVQGNIPKSRNPIEIWFEEEIILEFDDEYSPSYNWVLNKAEEELDDPIDHDRLYAIYEAYSNERRTLNNQKIVDEMEPNYKLKLDQLGDKEKKKILKECMKNVKDNLYNNGVLGDAIREKVQNFMFDLAFEYSLESFKNVIKNL